MRQIIAWSVGLTIGAGTAAANDCQWYKDRLAHVEAGCRADGQVCGYVPDFKKAKEKACGDGSGAKASDAPGFSCRVNGTVVFTDPSSSRCFDFRSAPDQAPFRHGNYIYKWIKGSAYTSLEQLMAEQRRLKMAVAVSPSSASPAGPVIGAEPRGPKKKLSGDKLSAADMNNIDCASCISLTGIRPDGGPYCRSYWSNSCGHPVEVHAVISGGPMRTVLGLSGKLEAHARDHRGDQITCAWVKSSPAVGQVKSARPPYGFKGTIEGCQKRN
jgi:hypothetical protein